MQKNLILHLHQIHCCHSVRCRLPNPTLVCVCLNGIYLVQCLRLIKSLRLFIDGQPVTLTRDDDDDDALTHLNGKFLFFSSSAILTAKNETYALKSSTKVVLGGARNKFRGIHTRLLHRLKCTRHSKSLFVFCPYTLPILNHFGQLIITAMRISEIFKSIHPTCMFFLSFTFLLSTSNLYHANRIYFGI